MSPKKDRPYRPTRQNSYMTDLFFCIEPATDTELLYHTLPLHALVRKYDRHLQDKSMLTKLNKEDVID